MYLGKIYNLKIQKNLVVFPMLQLICLFYTTYTKIVNFQGQKKARNKKYERRKNKLEKIIKKSISQTIQV